jgi:tetratricopeptide (TPR) repeat protein
LKRRLKARWFAFLGRRMWDSEQWDSALAYFRKADEQVPDNPRTMASMAWCLYTQEKHEAAIQLCDRVLRQLPTLAEPRAYRAAALAGLDRKQEAVEELQRAFRMGFPVKGKAQAFWENRLGTWLLDLGNYEEAIEHLKRSVQLNPNEPATRTP